MNLPTGDQWLFLLPEIRKTIHIGFFIHTAAKKVFPLIKHIWRINTMTFFKDLDTIMKQDFGNRGLLKALPDNPIQETLNTLADARRVILLTGFPVRLSDGSYVGEPTAP